MNNTILTLNEELQNYSGFESNSNFQVPNTNEVPKRKLEINLHNDKINEDELENNIESKYPYLDENEQLKYRIIKFIKPNSSGNLFAVESKGSNGQMISGMNGTEKIPYNIPDLIKANGNVVYVVNGENKVEALRKLGIIATTAPFNSAKKWDLKFNKYLASAGYIIVLADNKETKQYTQFLDITLETIKLDYPNVARVDIVDYLEYFGVNSKEVRTIIDLINLVPKEQILEFFNSIEKTVLGTKEV